MKRLATVTKNNLRQVRHSRIRATLVGSAQAPRLSVFRSLRAMNAQLIDDASGKTLVAVKSEEVKAVKVEGKAGKVATAYAVGKTLAEKAKAKGITTAVFDRGGYRYHGRVQALADGAREGGLQF